MKTKHTPGPWKVVNHINDEGETMSDLVIQSEVGRYIGTIENLITNGKPNAKLIAASPELFQSLNEMTAILVCRLGDRLTPEEVKQLQHALDLISRLENV